MRRSMALALCDGRSAASASSWQPYSRYVQFDMILSRVRQEQIGDSAMRHRRHQAVNLVAIIAIYLATSNLCVAQSGASDPKDILPLNDVTGLYPARALSAGLEGRVLVSFDIDSNGAVSNARILESTSSFFERMSIRTASTMKFTPATVKDVRVTFDYVAGQVIVGTPTTKAITLSSERPGSSEMKYPKPPTGGIKSLDNDRNPDIYGVRLGMTLEEVINALRKRHPEAKQTTMPLSKLPPGRAGYDVQPTGLSFSFRANESESQYLAVGFFNPTAKSDDLGLVTSVQFTHSNRAGKFTFDYFDFFRTRYGPYKVSSAQLGQTNYAYTVNSPYGNVEIRIRGDKGTYRYRYTISMGTTSEQMEKLKLEKSRAIRAQAPSSDEPF